MVVTASVVLYNTPKEDIKLLLDSICKSSLDLLLYIIDNSPTDSLLLCIKKYENLNFKYTHNPKNNGYSAHNIAIELAMKKKSKYHFVLNPDIYFDEKVLGNIVVFLNANSSIGLLMPKILYPNGNIQYVAKLLPRPIDLILRIFVPSLANKLTNYDLRFTEYKNIMDIPNVSGCFMAFNVNALKQTGGFDPRYFMYAEDMDLSRRIRQNWDSVFYPIVSIYHKYEKASFKNKRMFFVHIKSIILYFNKWGWFFDKERRRINKKTLADIKQYEIKYNIVGDFNFKNRERSISLQERQS